MISIEKVVISLIFMASSYVFCENYTENKLPTILFAIFARNKEHTLPYYLTYMERLDYPKDRISLWIRSDHNEDNTLEILKNWLSSVRGKYHSISTELLSTPPERHNDETGPTHWSPKRFTHMIQLREEALRAARYIWADYIWFIDCDVFLTNNQTLKELIQLNKTVSAPMLKSDGMYSNFWCGMTEDYYYIRTDEYKPTLTRSRMGCFEVPMIHSAVLIDLRKKSSSNLTFIPENIPNYEGPHDDIISFAISANKTGVPLNICNQEIYGYILVPLDLNDSLEDDILQLTNIKLEVLVDGTGLQVNDQFKDYIYYPEEDTLAFDRIYMINLARRPKRRERMLQSFKELGLRVTTVPAVDGKWSDTLENTGVRPTEKEEEEFKISNNGILQKCSSD